MKKLWLSIFLLCACSVGISQPQGSSAYITELFYNEDDNWTLELYFNYFDTRDTGYLLVSPTDTGFFRKFPDSAGFVILTQADLDRPFSIRYPGDSLGVINPMRQLYDYGRLTERFTWGDFDKYGVSVNPPGPGQSISRLNNIWDYNYWEHYFFLMTDTVHSPGFLTRPPKGTVEGYLFDSTGVPLPHMGVNLSGRAEDCKELLLWTDENGFFHDTSLFAKNYFPFIDGFWYPEEDIFTVVPGGMTMKSYTFPINKNVAVEGICLLEDNDNAEGTRIIFDNLCPGVEPDTIYADASGYFIYETNPGIYNLRYSHDGYIPYPYYKILQLNESEYISTQTLSPGEINEVPPGNVSGVWDDDDPYWIFGDIAIEAGDSLIVMPGVSIVFLDYLCFDVYGTLIMEGTPDQYISMDQQSQFYNFNGLIFRGELANGSRLDYINFESNGGNVGFYDASPVLDHINAENGVEVHIYGSSEPAIRSCLIGEGNFPEIFIGDNAKPVFRNNIFNDVGFSCSGHSSPVIEYNDFYDGYDFIRCYDYANPKITGNIFFIAYRGIYVYHGYGLDHVKYNSFFGLETAGYFTGLPGFCELDTINMNGDSCDYYFNITKHPRLVDPENGDFRLLEISPCIDAGDPASPPDPDSTIADIGALYFDQLVIVIEPVDGESCEVNVYPNPSSGTVNFDIKLPGSYPDKKGIIRIFQSNGILIKSYPIYYHESQPNNYRFDGLDLRSGTYFYEVELGGEKISGDKLFLLNR
jgi:hypothetical protein